MDEKNKVKRYISGVLKILSEVKTSDEKIGYIVDLAERYCQDAQYYLNEKGDVFTSLACIAYSEGLLDALRFLGFLDFEWPREIPKEKRVLVGGVFDLLHPGHVYLLKKAKEKGRLIVIIARDDNVKKMKGRPPVIPEEQRLAMVKSIRYVNEAYLGEKEFSVEKIIEKYKPDIIVLGPDQDGIAEIVEKAAAKHGVKVERISNRVKNFPLTSSSQIVKKILEIFGKLSNSSRG